MFLIESPELILLFTILFAVGLFFYVNYLRIIVPTDKIHIIKTKKTTMFFGQSINRRGYYYHFPSWMPVLGVEEKAIFKGGIFNIEFINVKHANLYQEEFESNISVGLKIIDPLQTIRFSKSYGDLQEKIKREILNEIREEMKQFDESELMQKSQTLANAVQKQVNKMTTRYGVETKDIQINKMRKTSEDKATPDFDLNKISKLGENANRVSI